MKKILLSILFIFSAILSFAQGFTPGNIVVSRYGSGIEPLPKGKITVPVFLDEYNLEGNKIQTLPMPVVKSEATRNRVLTGGVKSVEGLLTLSPNGHYLVAIGHNTPPGTSYKGKQRTVGVITSDGFINIKTAVRSNLGLPRCAVTNNGVNLWIVGSGGGLKYNSINAAARREVILSAHPSAHNSVYIYNGQLYYTSNYVASATGPKIGVVGQGLPNEESQTVNNLPGFPTNYRPGQILMLDHDTSTPEPDLLYVTNHLEGNLEKWVFDGTNWQEKGAVYIAGITNHITGITGNITAGNVLLYTNTPDEIVRFTDSTAISSVLSETSTAHKVLATAQENTIFRGIAFTPGTTPEIAKKVSSSSGYADLIRETTDLIRQVKKNETFHPYPGVEETHLSYISNRGVPVALFFLKVNLKNPNTAIEALTPYDDAEFARQQVSEMITYKNESDTERQVVAASNGDYFHWTGEPDGAVHKNGQIIKELPDRKYFFGIRDNGMAIIGDKRIYDNVKEQLKEAISGRFFLMHYGEIMTDHLKDTSIEPRTTVGILSPEHVVFMWVDGRRAGHSAGLSLRDMASIYKAIGATDAINLDGGGSTTFIMREKDGTYVPHNKPSDASGERAVGNGLAVMMKTEILEKNPGKKHTSSASEIFVYPNAVEDHVNIFIEKEKNNPALTMTLTNASGVHLMRGKGSLEEINEQVNQQIPNLDRGVYIIKVNGKKGTYSSRLIKK